MKKVDNPRGFFNWQGNVFGYNYVGNYVVIGLIIIMLFVAVIFKKRLRAYFLIKETNRVFVFKNINSFLQSIGILMIFIWVFRIAILVAYDYPLYYEHIGLHLCRIHFILISLLLTFKKKEFIRYMLYISILSSIIGIGFGATKYDLNKPNNIFIANGFSYYNAGIDTHYYWDYHITHLLTGILPIIITIGINKKITTVAFYRTMLVYVSFAIFVFIINYLTDLSSVRSWRSNYWYLGRDRNNIHNNFLGSLTAWPQNLASLLMVGITFLYLGHFALLAIDGNVKVKWKAFIASHNKQTFHRFFQFKQPPKKL